MDDAQVQTRKIFYNRMKISKFIVGGDETQIKLGKDYFWLWVVAIIKPKDKDILLHIHISAAERNMFVAEHFLRSLVKKYGRYPVSTNDGGGTWYHPQACKFLQIKHHLHSLYEKNIIERRIQYIKDRTECFDELLSM
jgi:putative transposase